MDQDQDNSHEESLVNLLTLPTELLVYIISFLSSLRDRVKLRYVSRWLRIVIEETPSLWKEFVWPYYNSREECSVKEVLKVCGQHIKILSFPNSRVSSTLVEMLQYCCNVQHLGLPSTKLDPEQLRNTIHHMGCLQTLELTVENSSSDVTQLFLNAGQLRELTIFEPPYNCKPVFNVKDVIDRYILVGLRPLRVNLFTRGHYSLRGLMHYADQLTPIPPGTTTTFRLYNEKVPLNFSPTFPYFQLQVEGSGPVTTPCIKLSDFGILGLSNDVALMTDCHYGVRTMSMVRYQTDDVIVSKLSSKHITRCNSLSCVAHFDLAYCYSLHFGHLEQIAIACPNLQRLNLQNCFHCLNSLQGLWAIASHCHNLEGLNLVGINVSNVEDHILLWEILSNMKLTHLAVEFKVLKSEPSNKEKLMSLYQKCCTIRGIQCGGDRYVHAFTKVGFMLSCFSSLNYCFMRYYTSSSTIVQDVITNCKELRCVSFHSNYWNHSLSLSTTHNHNLQQLHIYSSETNVPDDFMTSVSAHGGLVHVAMRVRSLTVEGITSLVRNSPKLITLHWYIFDKVIRASVENYNATIKEMFWNRKLFTAGQYKEVGSWEYEQGTDLNPLW